MCMQSLPKAARKTRNRTKRNSQSNAVLPVTCLTNHSSGYPFVFRRQQNLGQITKDQNERIVTYSDREKAVTMEESGTGTEVYSQCYEKLPLRQLLGWTVLQFVYTFAGASLYIFMEECYGSDVIKSGTYQALVNYVENDAAMTDREKQAFINVTAKFFRTKEKRDCSFSHGNLAKWWKFTTVTCYTIGYGDTTPKTAHGKLATILYASIGIPCTISMYTCASELVRKTIRNCVKFIEIRGLSRSRVEWLHGKTTLILGLVFVILFTSFAYLNTLESQGELSALDSCYFWFQTLTTIGYGDVYPQADHNDWIEFMLRIMVIFGLGITASLITSVAAIAHMSWTNVQIVPKRTKRSWNVERVTAEATL